MSNPENNPSQNKQHLIQTEKPNVGFKYEVRVATLVAAMLSTNKQIENYQIFSNLKEARPFDDVVAKVYLQEKDDPYAFAIQVKSGNDQSFGVEKYFKTWKKLKAGGLHIVDRIDTNNIHFCYFAVKNELRNAVFVNKVRTTKEYKLLPHNPTNEWWRLALPFKHCQKLSYDEQINETNSNERKGFIDNFYLYMSQPDMDAIEERIKENCKINGAADIFNYVDRYFENDELRERGLAKEIFETELLKIRLSDYIVSPENVIQLNDSPVAIWNELTLKHDVTIVEHEENIELSLYGCLTQMLNHLLNKDIEWNEYERKNLNSTIISKFKELFQRNESSMVRHWISPPTTLKELIIELWKCGELPLILKTEEELSILKEYAHLHKKYIIITKKLISRREEIGRFPLSVFTRISDVNKCLEVRDELLRAISVSIHGRKPITLYSMVNGHEELTTTLSCAHILHLMKTRKAYLAKECLDVEHDMIFLINDPNCTAECNIDSVNKIIGNTAIRCRPDESIKYRKEIEKTPKLEGYEIYNCTVSSENENFILDEGNGMLLRDYFVDQYGESVYNLDGDIVPILGNNFRSIQQDYIPRFLCNAIVSKSLFDSPTKGICFFSGDLTCLDVDIEKHILELSLDTIEEEMLLTTENHFVKVKSEDINNYWIKATKLRRPLLHIRVEGCNMYLSNCKNWNGLSDHISFSGQKIPEKRFLTELTGAITVLTGEPGIGKSFLLRSLFKNHGLEKYILFYNLTDYKEKEKNKWRDINSSLDFILNKVKDTRYSEFLSNLFKRKEKLLVVLDSFDEVLPNRKDDILNFIQNVVDNNIQIIIASRLITNYILMDNFEINIFKVDILNEENRKEYFKKCKLGEEMLTTIPPEFLENPLYLNLLKLISQNGVHLPDVSKFALFENIVRIKLNEYFKKFFSSDLESDKECYLEPVLEKHFKLALVRIVGVNAVEKLLGWTCEKQLSNHMKLGIILSIDEDGYPTFVHETFAEYLTAAWIVKNKNEISAKEIYMEMLNQNKMYVLDILCDRIELHKAVLILDREKIERYSNDRSNLEKTDALGRTALHVFAARYHSNYLLNFLLFMIIYRMRKFKVNCTDSDDLMEWDWVQHVYKGNHIDYILDIGVLDLVPLLEAYANCIVQKLRAGVELCILNRPFYEAPNIYGTAIKACSIDLIRDYFFIEDIALNGISQANKHRECRALEADELSLKKISGLTPLHVACIYGNVDAVTTLVNMKHDVNVTDNFGCTPLHYSVMHPLPVSVDMTEILIENGAKLDVANKWEDIPITIAARSRNIDLMEFLLQKIDTDHSREKEVVPLCLFLALEKGDRNMIELLLKYQLHADIVDKDYLSILLFFSIIQMHTIYEKTFYEGNKTWSWISAENSDLDCIKLLLEYGANVNGTLELAILSHIWTPAAADLIKPYNLEARIKQLVKECQTPLMLASAYGSSDLVMLLLEKGANVNSTTTDDKTALMFASEVNVEKLLLAKYDSVDSTTTDGKATLMLASELKIAKLLVERGASVNSTTSMGKTPLMFASARGSPDIAKLLIEEGASVNSTTINNETALMFASTSVTSDVAKLLLEKGANVNGTTTTGITALMIASETLGSTVAKLLIDKGANVHMKTVENETALTIASEICNLEIITLLLALDVDVNSATTDGRTPLMLAAKCGRVDVLKLLLEEGAHVNSTTIDGRTPLMFAFGSINSDAAKLLLEKGAAVNSTTVNGETPLMLTIQCYHTDIVELLLQKGADINTATVCGKTALIFSIEKANYYTVELLLRKGADVNSTTTDGKTPLIFSIEKWNLDVVKLLLENGANVDGTTRNCKTPLMFACRMGFTDGIKLLLDKGADVNHITTSGRTPLFFAIEQTDTRGMVLLLQRGANVNSRTSNGETPLFYALKRRSIKTIKLLLKHGVDVNKPARFGKTPLYFAIEQGCVKTVKLLLEHGAGVNRPARHGKTPPYYAIERNCIKLVKLLLKRGADVNRPVRDGKTPLYFAVERSRIKLVKLLLKHGADVNRPVRDGKTSFYFAVERSRIKLVKLLLKHGADVNRSVRGGKTPLYFAVEWDRGKTKTSVTIWC